VSAPGPHRVIKELLTGEPSTRLEGAGAIDVPALLDREYRLNMYSFTQVTLLGHMRCRQQHWQHC